MGSLPNLNDLCRQRLERRAHEKERVLARERAREREFSRERERERLPIIISQMPAHGVYKHTHRHSLTSRRVHRTRSSGATHHIWDDPMIEHMNAYSPVSSRSHRITSLPPPYQNVVQCTSGTNRRRESVNSSIGTTSVRRLLIINRGCRHKIPSHVRSNTIKNFIFLAVAHGLACAAFIPVVGLQGSNSLWIHRDKWLRFGPDIGSLLLSLVFFVSAGMCLVTTRLIRKLGFTVLIAISYTALCIFFAAHLWPSIYTLVPAYLVLGITLGPAWVSKVTLVVSFASKLSCNQPECNNVTPMDSCYDDQRLNCGREEGVRRLGRWFHAAQDLGIIVGALIASFFLTCAFSNQTMCFMPKHGENIKENYFLNGSIISGANASAKALETSRQLRIFSPDLLQTISRLTERRQDDWNLTTHSVSINELSNTYGLFDLNHLGERICGADSCPVWSSRKSLNTFNGIRNGSIEDPMDFIRTHSGALPLLAIFVGFSVIALMLTTLSTDVDTCLKLEPVRGFKETLMGAGTLVFFIGTEQGYMLADFTKAFVSCSLGPQMVAGALVGMGIMQFIASTTLSMLLRHTKRIVVIVAGFFFHACLLLVLSRWKPSKDDSALFYVIAAAWGVCNAVWETLCFALVTLSHHNHVAEVSSSLQALRFLGLGVTFAAHGFLCEYPKILIMTVMLTISVPPYAILESRLESQRKSHSSHL